MVFKKFTDRILSAGTAAANTLIHGADTAEKIQQLEAMGFSGERARHALNATDGNVDRAAELLLLGANEQQLHDTQPLPRTTTTTSAANNNNNAPPGIHVAAHNDAQMRRAIEESLAMNQQEQSRQLRQAENASMGVIDLRSDTETNSTASAAVAKKKTKTHRKTMRVME